MGEEERYEGRRMKKMRVALDKTIHATFANFTEKTVSNCFPLMAKSKPELLRTINTNLVSSLSNNLKEEFDKICEERDTRAKLNLLDELTDEQKSKLDPNLEETVPPPLNESPASLIARRKLEIKEQQKENLHEQLIKLEEEQKVLKAELLEQQKTKRKWEETIVAEMAPLERAYKVATKWKELGTKQWVDGMELLSGLST